VNGENPPGGSIVETMSDTQLVVLSQEGSRRAFGLVAKRQQGALYRFLRRLLGDEEEARDACQETLLKAFLNVQRLREPRHFKSWIHQIAINLCRDRGRSLARESAGPGRALPDSNGEVLDASQVTGSLAQGDLADLSLVLREVLGRLSLEQRSAILLREVQGFNSEEIARITGVPAATVRSRIYHGLRSLRKMLPEYGVAGRQFGEGGTRHD
jgi:RNA polymerase sigma-70 factor (ECF subfamily)